VKLRLALLTAFALLWAIPAVAQPVQQSGSVTPGHIPYWVTNGVIGGGGGGTGTIGNGGNAGTYGGGGGGGGNSSSISGSGGSGVKALSCLPIRQFLSPRPV
jgi:hypothetical protein